MKRLLTSAVVVLVVGSGSEAEAQEMMRRASRFDLGVYGGGAYTTPWFSSQSGTVSGGTFTATGEEESFAIGFAPIFGANATYWATPNFGLRLHGAYMPSDLPEAGNDGGGTGNGGDDSGYVLNNYFYDLSLIFRLPGLPLLSTLSSNLYGWAGGGGLTSNLAGETGPRGEVCQPRLLREGACLTYDPEFASVGQGVVGIGGDVVSLTANLGVFFEAAAHIYDSPVHVGDAFVPPVRVPTGGTARVANDRYAVTPRLVLGIKAAFGEFGGAPMVAPLPPVVAPPPPPPPAAPAMQTIRVCVVEGTALREVEAMYNPATGDTMVAGQRFSMAFPATAPAYAAGATWFINNEPIMMNRRRYVKFGLPRVVSPTDVRRIGEHQGVGVFADATATGTPDVIYIPVRPGCEFQPYQYEVPARGVRG
ncbi:MAG TPA: hypothetical protein VGR37_00820 [Longimicrobiaceae bacterium]|nr:hypothetical protein [Longimicrobiaceae bacterium]